MRILLCAIALLTFLLPAHAQDARWPINESELAYLQRLDDLLLISDRLIAASEIETLELDGRILILAGSYSLSADRVFLDRAARKGWAKGNVRLTLKEYVIEASEMTFDLENNHVTCHQLSLRSGDHLRLKAQMLAIVPGWVRLEGAELSTCQDEAHPDYRISAAAIDAFPDLLNENLRLHQASLWLGPWKLFTLPTYRLSVDVPWRERESSRLIGSTSERTLLTPSLSLDPRKGLLAKLQYHYLDDPQQQGFLTAEYGLWSRGAFELNHEWQALPGTLIEFQGGWQSDSTAILERTGFYSRAIAQTHIAGHRWQLTTSWRELLKQQMVSRLPEVAWFSPYWQWQGWQARLEAHAGYAWEPILSSTGAGRLGSYARLDSPLWAVLPEAGFSLSTEWQGSIYTTSEAQQRLAGQISWRQVFSQHFNYALSYRQGFASGSTPFAFDRLTPFQSTALELGWRVNDAWQVGSFSEFDLAGQRLSSLDFLVSYTGDCYRISGFWRSLTNGLDLKVSLLDF